VDLKAPGILEERAVAPKGFALAGRVPRHAARPQDRHELVEMVRAAARDGLAIVPWGGGVSLAGVRAPEAYDVAIDLGGLDRVVEYEAEDLTLTAEAGVTLSALRERLGARGQELPIEGAQPARATLGGALAANASGPRRLRFGAPRDRILGARFVLGDGTLARTGGKVVKNVAGYGIHRMLCGSRGALAILVDASLKLLPAPAERLAMLYALPWEILRDARRWHSIGRIEPSALTLVSAGLARGSDRGGALSGAEALSEDRVWTAIGIEDDPPRVDELRRAVANALGEPTFERRGVEAEALWEQLTDLQEARPSRLAFTSPDLDPIRMASAVRPGEAFVHHAACGRLHLFTDPSVAQSRVNEFEQHGFTLIEAAGVEVAPAAPAATATHALRASIRAALDPAGRFAFGKRWESTFFEGSAA